MKKTTVNTKKILLLYIERKKTRVNLVKNDVITMSIVFVDADDWMELDVSEKHIIHSFNIM